MNPFDDSDSNSSTSSLSGDDAWEDVRTSQHTTSTNGQRGEEPALQFNAVAAASEAFVSPLANALVEEFGGLRTNSYEEQDEPISSLYETEQSPLLSPGGGARNSGARLSDLVQRYKCLLRLDTLWFIPILEVVQVMVKTLGT